MSSPTSISRLKLSWVQSFSKETSSEQIQNLLNHDTDKHEKLAQTLKHLTDEPSTHKDFIINGGIQAVIHTMATSLPDQDIQVKSANLLTILANDERAAVQIGLLEGVQALRDCLTLHHDNATLWVAALTTLELLTVVSDNRKTMLQCNMLKLLIKTMNNFLDHETLCAYIPATVANIVFGCTETHMKTGQLSAIETFTNVMMKHSSCAQVVAQCGFAIRNLIWECPQNLQLVLNNDTIPVMLDALSKHRESQEVATQMLGAFANMASSPLNVREKLMNRKTFLKDLFHIMSTFVDDSNLCATICFVLFTLGDHDVRHDWAFAHEIANHSKDTDSYTTIVSGLKHAIVNNNENAIANFSALIHVLSASEDFKTGIASSKALEVSINALRENSFEEETVAKLLRAIWPIISGNDEAKLKFKELDGYSVTLEVMKRNLKSSKIVWKCTQVLDLAADGQLHTTEHLLDRKEQMVSLILTAMADFADMVPVQENACSILVKIASISPEEASKLVKAGARTSVELTRSRHGGNPAVESLANQLLSLLVDNTSGREGRGNARGTAGSRLRSRSRTVQSGGRSRSRAEKSKSPDRMLKQARRALEAAKLKQGTQTGQTNDLQRSTSAPVEHLKRNTRPSKRFNLEPVYE